MDVLEFMEETATATLKVAADGYDSAYERVNKLATLIAGGAGAAGVYALGKIGVRSDLFQVLPLLLLAIWWLGVAATLVLTGSKSREVNLGANSIELRKIYNEELGQLESADNGQMRALEQTRWRHLDAIDEQIRIYSDGLSNRSEALDKAYRALAASPLPAVIGIVLAAAANR
jgi:hypothetical protein